MGLEEQGRRERGEQGRRERGEQGRRERGRARVREKREERRGGWGWEGKGEERGGEDEVGREYGVNHSYNPLP